jgi:hypothetical protein
MNQQTKSQIKIPSELVWRSKVAFVFTASRCCPLMIRVEIDLAPTVRPLCDFHQLQLPCAAF